MAPEHNHFERIFTGGNSRAHIGPSLNTTLEARNDGGSRIANQAGQQTIHGGQHNYFGDRSPHPTTAARPSRYVSVPFATVPTYTERPHLTEELEAKLRQRHGGAGLAYAVAVIGLGGTGKTQLVLHYIEEHEEEWDTILWIDVRSEETARSSYERCCHKLGLRAEAALNEGPLQDVPLVQMVLSWLRDRSEDKRWLVVVDNADNLSWDVSGVVPKGKAGTVIVTSQDALASRLLGGRTPTVKVDVMEPEEAVRLVSNYFDEPLSRENGCLALVEEITECLDRLALAMDLAGARVWADVENGDDMATALRQYIDDYKRSRDRLLRDEEFARISLYKKTVWTAWETSLSSLREAEDSQPDTYPVQLLSFLTLLDRANVQNELFRLASLGLEDACDRLNVNVPTWMQVLLGKGKDDEWDDSCYRTTMRVLQRYGLVRSVGGPWKGVTMHSLVKWRAGAEIDPQENWQRYLIFIGAVCVQIAEKSDKPHFRRHLVVHFPLNSKLFGHMPYFDSEKPLRWIWEMLGNVWRQEGRFEEAGQLQTKLMELRRVELGEEHLDTLNAMADLGLTCSQQGLWERARNLDSQVIEIRKKVLGEEHPDTLTAMHHLSITLSKQGQWEEAVNLDKAVLGVRKRVLGENHPDTIHSTRTLALTYSKQGRWKEAEELEVKVVEASRGVLGEQHSSTLSAIGNLAVTYSKQGRWKEAEELEVKVVEASRRVLGEEHPDTITAMANLAHTKRDLGQHDAAVELMIQSAMASSRVLGDDHPDCRSRHEQALLWSSMISGDNGKDDQDIRSSCTQ
ncbi:hypothetical protein MBLNU13_g00533t2 [Cladosporium sp. NU13]